MQNSVLYTANVLVYRQPIVGRFLVKSGFSFGIAKPSKIPRRLKKGVESICLAKCIIPTNGTLSKLPRSVIFKRIARFFKIYIFRK